MRIFKITDKIDVVCEWKKTRTAFKHTATLFLNGNEQENVKICYLNRTWEQYEFESVLNKLLGVKKSSLSDGEKKIFKAYIENYDRVKDDLKPLKGIAMIAKMGELFGTTQKEKNDWKARMLKTGLEGKGLIMPDDWDALDEVTKQARLDGAIKELI